MLTITKLIRNFGQSSEYTRDYDSEDVILKNYRLSPFDLDGEAFRIFFDKYDKNDTNSLISDSCRWVFREDYGISVIKFSNGTTLKFNVADRNEAHNVYERLKYFCKTGQLDEEIPEPEDIMDPIF